MTTIVGREAELQAGEQFLAALETGPSTLLLEGEAGIGKTTVWAELLARAEARGMRVLVARPVRPERTLSLATLADLLTRAEAPAWAGLPEPQRRALDAVIVADQSDHKPIASRLLGTATRALLARIASDRPVILAVDDVQWTDPASASVLGFALRRAESSRIGLLAARRSGEPLPEPLDGLFDRRRTTIGPMSVAGLHHVIRGELGDPPSRPTMVRVHAAAAGNPLFALEIVRLLHEIGEPPPHEPLPVPGDVRALIGKRIRRLPGPVRESLLVASAVAQPNVQLLAGVLGREVSADLEAAEDHGLIEVVGNAISFRHPLYGAAIYGLAAPEQRRRVHRDLGTILASSEEGARHAALAAEGPDRDVAAGLERAAIDVGRRGAPAAAAELLELAIQLTPSDATDDRERRSVARGDEMARSGDTARAVSILERAVTDSVSPANRVRARLKLASIRYDIDPDESNIIALCEAALAEPFDDVALLALAHATYAAASWGDPDRLRLHANEALRLIDSMPDPDPATVGLAVMAKVESDVEDGRRAPPDPVLVARGLEAEQRAARPAISERFSSALGVFLKYADDFEGARPWLEQTLQTAIDEGDESGIPYALSHLPQLELWTGNWSKAEDYARRHLEVAIDTGLEFQRQTAMYNLAIVHVHQGRVAEARAEIESELTRAEAHGNRMTLNLLLATRCLLELSVGNLEQAVRDGRRATEIRDSFGNLGRGRHDADVIEALVGLGDLDAAEAVLARVEGEAPHGDLPTYAALAHRARAMVEAGRGDTDAALASLRAAFAAHDQALNPFDRARTRLALGQVHRRRRERRLARESLEAALAEFERLGAPLWASKARDELNRLGIRRGVADDVLTEMERRVAELAARGAPNKDVAAQLGVSPKTVEAHLSRAYAKLGIASRAELGARLGRSTASTS